MLRFEFHCGRISEMIFHITPGTQETLFFTIPQSYTDRAAGFYTKGFQDPGMNSFNHYAYGAIGQWLYATVAGIDIDPEQPAYKRIISWSSFFSFAWRFPPSLN